MAFESIPTVLTAQELMDKAYGRASKLRKEDRDRGHRHRKTTLAQFEALRNIIDDTLGRYVTKFPSLDQVAPYHRELIKLLIGEDDWRRHLGGVDAARKRCSKMLNRGLQEIRHETDVEVLKGVKNRMYGRLSSVIRTTEDHLEALSKFRGVLRRFPTVSPGLFTVVIAGHPNVGKSSLIRALTKAEPEVASYPFTTKAANVGHLEVMREGVPSSQAHIKIQLIDTPGLLDRAEEERNAIEHQAALALKHLADVVLFLRDPTGHCGYPVSAQQVLLADVEEMTKGVELLVVESKADLADERGIVRPDDVEAPLMRVSTATNEGIEELTKFLVDKAGEHKEDAALEAYLTGNNMPSRRATLPKPAPTA